jgi:hypothetical protein
VRQEGSIGTLWCDDFYKGKNFIKKKKGPCDGARLRKAFDHRETVPPWVENEDGYS